MINCHSVVIIIDQNKISPSFSNPYYLINVKNRFDRIEIGKVSLVAGFAVLNV